MTEAGKEDPTHKASIPDVTPEEIEHILIG